MLLLPSAIVLLLQAKKLVPGYYLAGRHSEVTVGPVAFISLVTRSIMKQLQPKTILAIGLPCSLLFNLFVSMLFFYIVSATLENWLIVGFAMGERMAVWEHSGFWGNGTDSIPHRKV